ncbi:MAG: sugar ABC transporter substrate-binding protein [Deltaproteobacteria bacterium]|nr:sugar ABC transporter substrate-binding protein [Deltaproteobacteria bacterium]
MKVHALLATSLALASCVAADDEEVATATSSITQQPACRPGRPVSIAWLGNDPGNTYDNASLDASTAVAAATRSTVTPFYAGFDPATQLAQCRAAVRTHRYDALVVIPDDSVGIAGCVAEARHRGIPVVAADLPIGPDLTTVEPQVPGQAGAVLVPPADFGSSLAALVVDACGARSPCDVAYIAGSFDVAFDQIALADLDAAAAAHPSIHIVHRDQAFYDATLAYGIAQTILADDPQIQIIIGAGDQMAQGVESAVADAGRTPGAIQIIGAGAGAYGVQAVRDGRWYATFVTLPADEGDLVARIAIEAARHHPIRDRGINPVEARGWPAFFTAANQALFVGFVPQWPG